MNQNCRATATITLTPPQSKKLLAEAVAVCPEVKIALKNGTIFIGVGTTNACIAERLTGKHYDELKFVAGIVKDGELFVNPKENRLTPIILRKGKMVDIEPNRALAEFGRYDVMIKGANAIDPSGTAGVLLGSSEGGTIGRYLGIIMARGANLIMPVGLEKLIPSVPQAARLLGQERIRSATGVKVGMMPVIGAQLITEIEAIRLLTGAAAVMVAAGGWGESQGAVTLAVSGDDEQLSKTMNWAHFVRGKRRKPPD